MGAYSTIHESTKPFSLDNPHQILCVGNGYMWVTNEGGNIQIGDYLISSSSQGMAMKDIGNYDVSYVCARSAQKVNWKKVKADESGVKKVLIHVLYESFEIENKVGESIEKLENQIKELKTLLKDEVKI